MLNSSALRHNLVLQIPATLLTMFLMWLLPLLVHLIPASGPTPLGALLLPIFYAPLIAIWFFHPGVALIASLAMPFVNYLLTGSPAPAMALLLSIELGVFSLALLAFRRRAPRLGFAAPLAFIAAKAVSAALLLVLPLIPAPAWAYFSSSIISALPGMLILLVLNLILIRLPHGR